MAKNPLDTLNYLRDEYETLTPAEREQMKTQWLAMWNPAVPIGSYFLTFEDLYEMSVANPPPYAQEQMIGKAIITIQASGPFPTALLESRAGPPTKNWQDLKQHFSKAYQLLDPLHKVIFLRERWQICSRPRSTFKILKMMKLSQL